MAKQAMGLAIDQLNLTLPGFSLRADFSVTRGERLGLKGRSGIGKTTLFRAIAGLRPWRKEDTGTILLAGENITHLPTHKRMIGYLFQEPALLDHMNVLDNVGLALRLQGKTRSEWQEVGRSWLEKVRLADKIDARIDELSGGEKQRVAFAQALIAQPHLLLLDEPFSALDRELRLELRRLLLELVSSAEVPAILVSHHADDLDFFSTKTLAIEERDDGRERVIAE